MAAPGSTMMDKEEKRLTRSSCTTTKKFNRSLQLPLNTTLILVTLRRWYRDAVDSVILPFIQEIDEQRFRYILFGGSRELTDNNDTNNDEAPKYKSSGAFIKRIEGGCSVLPFIGNVSGDQVVSLRLANASDLTKINNCIPVASMPRGPPSPAGSSPPGITW